MKDRVCVETDLGLCKHMQTAEPNEKASFGLSGLSTLTVFTLRVHCQWTYSTVMFLARST